MGRKITVEEPSVYSFTRNSPMELEERTSIRSKHVSPKIRMSIIHKAMEHKLEPMKGCGHRIFKVERRGDMVEGNACW